MATDHSHTKACRTLLARITRTVSRVTCPLVIRNTAKVVKVHLAAVVNSPLFLVIILCQRMHTREATASTVRRVKHLKASSNTRQNRLVQANVVFNLLQLVCLMVLVILNHRLLIRRYTTTTTTCPRRRIDILYLRRRHISRSQLLKVAVHSITIMASMRLRRIPVLRILLRRSFEVHQTASHTMVLHQELQRSSQSVMHEEKVKPKTQNSDTVLHRPSLNKSNSKNRASSSRCKHTNVLSHRPRNPLLLFVRGHLRLSLLRSQLRSLRLIRVLRVFRDQRRREARRSKRRSENREVRRRARDWWRTGSGRRLMRRCNARWV